MQPRNIVWAACWILVLSISLQSRLAFAQSNEHPSQPSVAGRYIEAVEKKDFHTIIDLTYSYQQDVANIKRQNPQVLWPKLIGEYYQGKTSAFSQQSNYWQNYGESLGAMMGDPAQSIRAMEELFPPSCKWSISETRRQRVVDRWNGREYTQEIDYVAVAYPSWQDAPLIENKVLQKTIVQFTVEANSGLAIGMGRVAAGDTFREEPFRISSVTWHQFNNLNMLFTVAGGAPPFSCTIQVATVRSDRSCYNQGAKDLHAEFDPGTIGNPPWPVHVKVLDSKGRTDDVSFFVPGFLPGLGGTSLFEYCWVRDPWFQRGLLRPDNPRDCKDGVHRLGEAAVVGEAVPAPRPTEPSAGQPAMPGPMPTVPPVLMASCGNYDACFNAALGAYKIGDWRSAITDFQAAANQRPSTGDPWVWLGRIYLRNGQSTEASSAWDKALGLDANLVIGVCHERAFQPCERGDLLISTKSISFITSGNEVFKVPPAGVTPKGVLNNTLTSHVSFGMEVAKRKYNFEFLPMGINCQIQLFVQCGQPGVAQQLPVANYVEQTLPKLSAGALSPAPPPAPTPAVIQVPAPSTSSQPTMACRSAVDAGYKLVLDGRIFSVRTQTTGTGVSIPIFYDAATTTQIADPSTIRRLALAAWTVDNVVLDPSYRLRKRSDEVASLLQTAGALKTYEAVQDQFVRASIEVFAATVSDGQTLGGSLGRVVKSGISAQLKDPGTYLQALTAGGLLRSEQLFQQMEQVETKTLGPTGYYVDHLDQIQTLYREASGLLQTFRPVALAMMPEHWTDLVTQAMSSVGSEVISVLESLPESATPATFVDALMGQVGRMQAAGDLQLLAQNAKFARDISAAIDRSVDRSVSLADLPCGGAPTAPSTNSSGNNYPNGDTVVLNTQNGPIRVNNFFRSIEGESSETKTMILEKNSGYEILYFQQQNWFEIRLAETAVKKDQINGQNALVRLLGVPESEFCTLPVYVTSLEDKVTGSRASTPPSFCPGGQLHFLN